MTVIPFKQLSNARHPKYMHMYIQRDVLIVVRYCPDIFQCLENAYNRNMFRFIGKTSVKKFSVKMFTKKRKKNALISILEALDQS